LIEDLAIILDGRPLTFYPLGKPGFHGGTELYVQKLAHGLAGLGHTLHIITNDLEHEEQRGPTEWWWGAHNHPTHADVVMAVSTLETISDLVAPVLVFLPNGIDPPLFGRGHMVDAVACFSQNHIDLMCRLRPELPAARCHITGLGVDLDEYPWPPAPFIPGRMLYANDPARGLLPTLNIFERVKTKVPEATLHITYDFDRQFAQHQWGARCMSEILWECKGRIEADDAIVSVGGLTHDRLVGEERACDVYAYPSDPPNTGSQIHGMAQIELAAAGAPLVLSDIEAFPEVFGAAAKLLPVVGSLRKQAGPTDLERVDAQDWADVVIAIMRDDKTRQAMSKRSRALAEKHTWGHVVERFQTMLQGLAAERLEAIA